MQNRKSFDFFLSLHFVYRFITCFIVIRLFFCNRIVQSEEKNTLICNHITQAFIKLSQYGFFPYHFRYSWSFGSVIAHNHLVFFR